MMRTELMLAGRVALRVSRVDQLKKGEVMQTFVSPSALDVATVADDWRRRYKRSGAACSVRTFKRTVRVDGGCFDLHVVILRGKPSGGDRG